MNWSWAVAQPSSDLFNFPIIRATVILEQDQLLSLQNELFLSLARLTRLTTFPLISLSCVPENANAGCCMKEKKINPRRKNTPTANNRGAPEFPVRILSLQCLLLCGRAYLGFNLFMGNLNHTDTLIGRGCWFRGRTNPQLVCWEAVISSSTPAWVLALHRQRFTTLTDTQHSFCLAKTHTHHHRHTLGIWRPFISLRTNFCKEYKWHNTL